MRITSGWAQKFHISKKPFTSFFKKCATEFSLKTFEGGREEAMNHPRLINTIPKNDATRLLVSFSEHKLCGLCKATDSNKIVLF